MCNFQHFILQYSTDWIHVSRLHGGKIWAAEAKQKCKKNIGVQSLLMEPSAGARCQETHWIRRDAVTFPHKTHAWLPHFGCNLYETAAAG